MTPDQQMKATRQALHLLLERCPRLAQSCYWAGTAAIAVEELHHRQSFDLDFHTKKALQDVRPLLAEIQAAFPDGFQIIQAPDNLGSAFQGLLALPDGGQISVEVLSNYEDVPEQDLVDSRIAPGVKRVSLARYLADKIQCIAERVEARDLVDIHALVGQHPQMAQKARRLLVNQDAVILVERLLAWGDEELMRDLAAYDDVDPKDASTCRDLLLEWLKEIDSAEEDPWEDGR